MAGEERSSITFNLKWLHLVLGVVTAVLTVMLTLGMLTNKYVDRRIEYHMMNQEKLLTKELVQIEERQKVRADARLAEETDQRKEQIRIIREDLVYIREKVDAIALHLDGRS